IFWTICLFIGLAWSSLNWYLSLAAIFVAGDGQSTFGALAAGAELCRNRAGAVLAPAIWFGLAHAGAFVVATSVVAFPLALAGVLPTAVVLGGVLVVGLIYFAVADFLYVGRLAAYVFLLEEGEAEAVSPQVSLQPLPSDDDILSDVPGLAEMN